MARLSLPEIEALALAALLASKTSPRNARLVAASVAEAEADGIASHGVVRVPVYCAHAASGKVDGFAEPVADPSGGAVLRVDARNGFAQPAIAVALSHLIKAARQHGVALVTIINSYNSGVMGHHVAHVADAGLLSLGFSNAPATIAPWGGTAAVFGTNPVAFAAPVPDGPPIVVDQAASVVARGEVILRAQRGEPVPESWGFDAHGRPTTDPMAILKGGTMAPAGGHKGVMMALVAEVFAGVLAGPCLSFEAGSLTEPDGRAAGIGQAFLAIDPRRLGDDYGSRMVRLVGAIEMQAPARLPGSLRMSRRHQATERGVEIQDGLIERLREIQSS